MLVDGSMAVKAEHLESLFSNHPNQTKNHHEVSIRLFATLEWGVGAKIETHSEGLDRPPRVTWLKYSGSCSALLMAANVELRGRIVSRFVGCLVPM